MLEKVWEGYSEIRQPKIKDESMVMKLLVSFPRVDKRIACVFFFAQVKGVGPLPKKEEGHA